MQRKGTCRTNRSYPWVEKKVYILSIPYLENKSGKQDIEHTLIKNIQRCSNNVTWKAPLKYIFLRGRNMPNQLP